MHWELDVPFWDGKYWQAESVDGDKDGEEQEDTYSLPLLCPLGTDIDLMNA